jgi:exopolysaccharide production protein ExoZ
VNDNTADGLLLTAAPRTLRSIQFLRGLAALSVVAFHTGWTHTVLGAAGVDVFFVISGFIMQHVSRRETTPIAFLRARILRVVPLYWLVTLAAAALHGIMDPARLAQSLVFWPHLDAQGHAWPVLLQGWTLCYEMFFYGLFAVSLLLPHRLWLMTAALLILASAGVALHPSGPALETYTSPLLLEFLAGMWLHRAWHSGWLRRARPLLPGGVAAFAAQVMLPDPGNWHTLAWGVPALMVVAGSLSVESSGRLPQVRWLNALSSASYALYLTHTLVQNQVLPLLQPAPAILAVPTAVAACVVVGMIVHWMVEEPIRRWLDVRIKFRAFRRQLIAAAPVPSKR